jgi:hypothetical protein
MQSPDAPSNNPPARRPIRKWPAWLIVAVTLLAIIYTRVAPSLPSQQHRNIGTIGTIIVAAVLLFLWAMLFSRLRWKTRGVVFGAVVVAMGLFVGLFQI